MAIRVKHSPPARAISEAARLSGIRKAASEQAAIDVQQQAQQMADRRFYAGLEAQAERDQQASSVALQREALQQRGALARTALQGGRRRSAAATRRLDWRYSKSTERDREKARQERVELERQARLGNLDPQQLAVAREASDIKMEELNRGYDPELASAKVRERWNDLSFVNERNNHQMVLDEKTGKFIDLDANLEKDRAAAVAELVKILMGIVDQETTQPKYEFEAALKLAQDAVAAQGGAWNPAEPEVPEEPEGQVSINGEGIGDNPMASLSDMERETMEGGEDLIGVDHAAMDAEKALRIFGPDIDFENAALADDQWAKSLSTQRWLVSSPKRVRAAWRAMDRVNVENVTLGMWSGATNVDDNGSPKPLHALYDRILKDGFGLQDPPAQKEFKKLTIMQQKAVAEALDRLGLLEEMAREAQSRGVFSRRKAQSLWNVFRPKSETPLPARPGSVISHQP